MKRWIEKAGKKAALAVLILAAGCSYSCGRKEQGFLLAEGGMTPEGDSREEDPQAGDLRKEDPEKSGLSQKSLGKEDPEKAELSQENLEKEDPEKAGPDQEGLEKADTEKAGPDQKEPEQEGTGDGSFPVLGADLQELSQEPEAEEPRSCFVYVCGEVVSPGVYELSEGERIYQAIGLAGGFTERAAEASINLAEPVWDGMKLEVPSREQVSESQWMPPEADSGRNPGGGMSGGQGPAGGSKVNLNTATKEELMTLTGIGEAKAAEILRYRQERGGFQSIEDIMNISGIKEASFQKIKDDITV